jgi:hypothetical protein
MWILLPLFTPELRVGEWIGLDQQSSPAVRHLEEERVAQTLPIKSPGLNEEPTLFSLKIRKIRR